MRLKFSSDEGVREFYRNSGDLKIPDKYKGIVPPLFVGPPSVMWVDGQIMPIEYGKKMINCSDNKH